MDRRELFDALDTNRDGRVCVRDVRRVMQMLGESNTGSREEEGWAVLLRAVEGSGLSCLGYQQFSALLADEDAVARRMSQALEDNMALEVFGHFDRNGDGYVSANELLESMRQVGVELTMSYCLGIAEKNDADGDGRLNLTEFQRAYRSVQDHDGDGGEQSNGDDAHATRFVCAGRSEVSIAQLLKISAGSFCDSSCSTIPDVSAFPSATSTLSLRAPASCRRSPQRRSLVHGLSSCWAWTRRAS